ncbi:bifunctional precorrin-2 dehydrogenase/sirohydrochlorin ferrochelatase, partial [Nitratireductor sp. ZSWI3]|uniref:precorrin-2 dehydrogenase/sirohydrochlorin ferrochelatase family protein n=1 Tax=Nitratireductor sp. ZSWI3 TaxID=2966359 RepID=UPI00214FAB1F
MATDTAKLAAFPVFMRVEGRAVVIVGNGAEALAKARLIGQSHAEIVLVADAPEAALADWAEENGARLIRAPYTARYIDNAVLVFAATDDEAQDRAVVADARARNIPANAVDRPALCDFYTPALVNRAPLVVAIGTEGAGPVLAQMVRARIDQMLSPSLGALAHLATQYRDAVERLVPKGLARRRFWKAFFTGEPARAAERGDLAAARRSASSLLA